MLSRILNWMLFTEIASAMKLTFRHMFVKPVTFQYPREKRVIPDAHRGALGLLRYEDGEERCVGCDLCEAACPSRCIKVVSEEHPHKPLERWAKEFYIDITKCVFCGYCVEACPVNALAMTKMYEYSTSNKRDLIFDKEKLYEIGERHMSDAKKYLVAHNQEKEDEYFKQYHYKFPFPLMSKKE
ncbi:MAG TPA: NADH-quinone oxidoreductase subunit NuoI [Nitrospiria bacterium]|nr:NADH-quinone oxidoreductase subunit NuoI [Nitrospiria bacterium]